jgi:hypothetical protein
MLGRLTSPYPSIDVGDGIVAAVLLDCLENRTVESRRWAAAVL